MRSPNTWTLPVWLVLLAGTLAAAEDDWRAVCRRLETYSEGKDNDADPRALERCLQAAGPATRVEIESAVVALLRDPKTPADAKRFLCRQGSFLCSPAAVTALADLQADPRFSLMACYALQRMPCAQAVAALRGLVGKRSGPALADVLRTLGQLRDRQAVGPLAACLKNSDRALVAATIAALGAIGGVESDRALTAFEPSAPAELKPAVAQARLRCADGLPPAQAAPIYQAYLGSAQPSLRMAALAGLLRAEPGRSNQRIIAALRAGDPALKSVALRHARTADDKNLALALAGLLPKLPAGDQTAVLDVLQQRGDPSVLAEVTRLVAAKDVSVRAAALEAIGVLGGIGQLDLLVAAAVEEDDAVKTAARRALAGLRGKEVNARLVAMIPNASASVSAMGLAALAERGAADAMPLFLASLDRGEPEVQAQAIAALARLAGQKEYPELVRRAIAAKSEADQQRLREVLVAMYRRSPSPAACVEHLIAALPRATVEGQASVLNILAAMGDPKGLPVLRQAIQSPDAERRKTALRALTNWPDAAPLADLTDLVRKTDDASVKILAIRAAAVLLGRDRAVPNPEKAKWIGQLLPLSPRADEKRLLIGRLPAAACPASLELAVQMLADPQLANEAAAAVAGIAAGHQRAGIPPAEVRAALDKAARVAKNARGPGPSPPATRRPGR